MPSLALIESISARNVGDCSVAVVMAATMAAGHYYAPSTGGDTLRTGRTYDVSPDDRFLMIVDAPVTTSVVGPQIALA